MPIEILMPALSPTMTEGNLARGTKAKATIVSAGDVIAEIETDKATMEVEAVDEGVLGKIVVSEGSENVRVNAVIGVLLEDGEDAGKITPAAAPAPAAAARRMADTVAPKATAPMPIQVVAEPDHGRATRLPDRPGGAARCDGGRNARPTTTFS